ncbi:MAG: hypothetical protein ACR2L2_07360 [Acidobacteriota bacterium]
MIRRGILFAFLLGVGASAALAQPKTILIPQLAHGQGNVSEILFINLTNTTNLIDVRTYDNSGAPINLLSNFSSPLGQGATAVSASGVELAGLGIAFLRTASAAPNTLQIAWAEVSSSGPVAVEIVISILDANQKLLSATSVLPQPLTAAFSFATVFSQTVGTGVALVNPKTSLQSANIRLRLFDRFGQFLGEQTVTLAPGGKTSRFVHELFTGLSNFAGSVDVRSDVPVGVMVLRVEGLHLTTQQLLPPR